MTKTVERALLVKPGAVEELSLMLEQGWHVKMVTANQPHFGGSLSYSHGSWLVILEKEST